MPAYMKLGDIEGESTDTDHDKWIILDAMSSPLSRSTPSGAKDQQRSRGETTLGDISIVRQLDKSSTKMQEACADGTYFDEVQIDFCSDIQGKREPYLTYKIKNVIVTSYSFHGNASGSPIPSEQVTLGYTEAEWTYIVLDPTDGSNQGSVVGSYSPGAGGGGAS